MKKIFLLLAAVGMIFTACEGGLDNEENGGNPATPKIELSQQNIEVGFKPAQYSVNITSPYSWEAISKNDWVIVDTKSGISGTKELKFSVLRNKESEIREGTIVIKNEDYNSVTELYITQKQPEFTRIFYTSSNGNIVRPNATNVFGTRIVSNTYENGKGIITFDAPVTSIGDSAFYNCTSLTSVTIPDSVTSIGDSAFKYCTSLTSVTIPDSVISIGDEAFECCSSLTSVTIPDSVTSIGDYAFSGCSGLTSITIPDSVTSIGDSAFYNCTSLTSVTIPNSVTSIGSYAFYKCSSLTSVTVPDSVTSIGEAAFACCTSLKAFYGKFASADNRCLIIDGVLHSFAPAGLTQCTIPDVVTSIGDSAFYNCTSLTSVTIPNSVTSIGYYAFGDCTSLTSVTIPDSVISIGEWAFFYCTSLTEVYCKPTTPPTGNSYMFNNNASGRKIYVPRNSVSAYKAATYWSDYADYIVGYDFE